VAVPDPLQPPPRLQPAVRPRLEPQPPGSEPPHSEPPDSDQLLERTAQDDPEAFGLFYRRHLDTVVGYFYRRTGCAHTSADLAAETFARALASAHRFRPQRGPATAWLLGIARNQLRHYQRRQRVAASARTRLGMSVQVSLEEDEHRAIEERFDASLQLDTLSRAWSTLRPALSEAVRLRVIDGMAYSAIAEALGCSEGAARVRVSRGLSALANAMGDP